MGVVFKAEDSLGRLVALKVIRDERLAHPEALRRFHREVRAAAQMAHPNVVYAHDAGQVGGTPFFVMEYVEGTDLAQLVAQLGPLPVAEACEYTRQAALGLRHAHQRGLVHRDIKPSNLLLTSKGVVKVLDLGLARLFESDPTQPTSTELTAEGAVIGTPDFIAPEQALDARSADIRSDLYSLGSTLYFLLTGRPPFPGGSLAQKLLKHQLHDPTPVERLRPEVPPGVAAVVRRLMAKRPRDRYQTPGEAAQALAGAAASGAPRDSTSTLSTTLSRAATGPRQPVQVRSADKQPPFTAALSGLWTSPRLLLAGSAVGLFLLLCMGCTGAVLWSLTGQPETTTPTREASNTPPAPPVVQPRSTSPPGPTYDKVKPPNGTGTGQSPIATPPLPVPDPNAPPRDVAEALARLRGTQAQRQIVGADWLAAAPLDRARQPEVARALDLLLDKADTRDAALRALQTWATRDNLPSLAKVLDDRTGTAWRKALEILGKFKGDPAAAAVVAPQLLDPHRRPAAVQALRSMGPAAQTEVVKYLHSKDPELRQEVNDLLQGYQTAPEVRLNQTYFDLQSADAETRRAAAQDLARTKPDPRVRADVAQALDPIVARDTDPETRNAAMDALSAWGPTRENVPTLVKLLDDSALKDRAYALLARLKDPRSLVPLAEHLVGPDRDRAGKALQDMGPMAEQVLIRVLATPAAQLDTGLRREVYRILGEVGTQVSVPALERMARVDRTLFKDAQAAIRAIKDRNK
jgi:serine/threonine protein kinase